MKRYLIIAAAGAAALVGALEIPTTRSGFSTAATRPVTQPTLSTTLPTTQYSRDYSRRDDRSYSRGSNGYPVQRLRDTPYSLLDSRSIFYKGRLPTREERNQGPITPPVSRPSDTTYTSVERTLVFEGAVEFDDEPVAFIEDFAGGGKGGILKVGDTIAGGKVAAINLDYMDYVNKAGKPIRVMLGKNLEGVDPPTTRPSYIATTADTPSTLGSSSSIPSAASPGMDSLMAKLKARRAAEGGN